MSNQTDNKTLALELFHVLHVNQLHYSIKHESWVGAVPHSDQLKTIAFENIVQHSAMFLSGITKERTNTHITRLLLEQIQTWVERSEGGIIEVFNVSIGAIRFIPACLQTTYPRI